MLAPTPVSLSLPVTGYTACKEVLIEGPLTCQPVSACLSDCSAAVCKETVHGGVTLCQYETACTQQCSIGKFCDAANPCQNVLCETNADCVSLSGTSVCKQTVYRGEKTCQQNSTWKVDSFVMQSTSASMLFALLILTVPL